MKTKQILAALFTGIMLLSGCKNDAPPPISDNSLGGSQNSTSSILKISDPMQVPVDT